MRTLIERIAKALVDYPDRVDVRELEGSSYTLLELRTHPSDVGKVIGRSGRTVNAMRTILAAVGNKSNKRYMLDVIQEESQTTDSDADQAEEHSHNTRSKGAQG